MKKSIMVPVVLLRTKTGYNALVRQSMAVS